MAETTTWRFKLKTRLAKWLVRLGKLTHVDYTVDELNQLLATHFPQSFKVDVPVGNGHFTLLDGQLSIPRLSSVIHVDLFCALDIDALGNPLYRAHVAIQLAITPRYDTQLKRLSIDAMKLSTLRLVKDEYALLNDSKQLLNVIIPKGMQSMLAGTFKSALGIVTVGSADLASDYLRMYLSGNKQKILDYHRPQIARLIEELKQDPEFVYEMNQHDWQENLFRQYGYSVTVENKCLRFKLRRHKVDG